MKNLSFVKGQDITFDVFLKKWDYALQPPAKVAVDVTGWASRWTCREGYASGDALLFSVSGSIVGSGTDGRFRYTVPGALLSGVHDEVPSEFKYYTDGLTANPPDVIEKALVTIREVLADS